MQATLTATFNRFVDSGRSSGLLLMVCTVLSLVIANSSVGPDYLRFWQHSIAGLSLEHWINDALMAVFFLLIGLELEREIYVGELSSAKNALLPIIAAIGGMVVPALIHFSLNSGTPMQAGFGIPMATDIAFALGVLAMLGSRVPAVLKVFVVAFAVIDDLGAIIVIAAVYTAQLSVGYLAGAIAVWAMLIVLNRLRVMLLMPYLLGGVLLWFLMLRSGVHATLAGVMLAFAIPFAGKEDEKSPSHTLENFLHKPVAFIVLPIFALANTGIVISAEWMQDLISMNSLGIAAGLIIGKPLGVTLACFAAVASGIASLPPGLKRLHIVGAGILGGIGFTMSIFITNLAFYGDSPTINASKLTIVLASLAAGVLGFVWLRLTSESHTDSVHG
ncbi:MAG: Na+/H+ antiporter NhaA [Candidatus Obscuribacterales bacterium]|nr:Na+/H+ antiporter NhaA [Steroidobacteraceae bacterium]